MPRKKSKHGAGKKARKALATKSVETKKVAAIAAFTLPEGVTPEFQAQPEGCLDSETATALVFSCTGVGQVNPATETRCAFFFRRIATRVLRMRISHRVHRTPGG